eukprot:824417-Pelagomonas_calceolata.AAC.1
MIYTRRHTCRYQLHDPDELVCGRSLHHFGGGHSWLRQHWRFSSNGAVCCGRGRFSNWSCTFTGVSRRIVAAPGKSRQAEALGDSMFRGCCTNCRAG